MSTEGGGPPPERFAEQLAVEPPFDPTQVHVHGPLPITELAAPWLHKFAIGTVMNDTPFDDPQTPFTIGSGGTYVHDWDNKGVPIHPPGVLEMTVLVRVLFDWHTDQSE